MKNNRLLRLAAILLLLGALTSVWVSEGIAQTQPPSGTHQGNERTTEIDLFGGSAYPGGYLKYAYTVSREGVDGVSTTTTEIVPEADGMYRIESSSTNTVPLAGVNIGFFGIPLRGLGFGIPTSSGGTVNLSPLSAIDDEILVPQREYILPDGGFLIVGEEGAIAGLDVIYATYTHADFANVQINLAMPVDLGIRNLLPIFPFLELEYASDSLPEENADEGYRQMRSFSQIELIEFIYEP